MVMKLKIALITTLALAIPGNVFGQPASSWTTKTGTISHVWLSQSANFAFRINLSSDGTDQFSSCPADFAYINESDDNYQVKVAFFLSAHAQQKTVTIDYYPDANGYCQIKDVGM
jgi:hypothetical protein